MVTLDGANHTRGRRVLWLRRRAVIQDAWVQLLSLLSVFSETLGKSFSLFLLRKISWLFPSFLLSENILVTSCAFLSPPHHRCWLIQAGQAAFSRLGRRVQVWELWGPLLEQRMWSHPQICYQDGCLFFHLSFNSLPPNTFISLPSLPNHPEVERKRRASSRPPHCETQMYYQSPLNQMWEQDYSNWCQLSTSYTVLQIAD